jgi:CBS domain-containing protein
MLPVSTPFAEALETLFKNRISGLALVDHEFKLSGNLSASDLRVSF